MEIENNLKQFRMEKGFKQTEIADKTKMSLISYQRYESGKRVPDVRTAQKIAKALGKTVEQLFAVVDDMQNPR